MLHKLNAIVQAAVGPFAQSGVEPGEAVGEPLFRAELKRGGCVASSPAAGLPSCICVVHFRRSTGGSPYAVRTAVTAKAVGGASGSPHSRAHMFQSGLPEHLMRESSRARASPLHQNSIVLSWDRSHPDRWISSLASCTCGWYNQDSLPVQRPCPVSSVTLCTTFPKTWQDSHLKTDVQSILSSAAQHTYMARHLARVSFSREMCHLPFKEYSSLVTFQKRVCNPVSLQRNLLTWTAWSLKAWQTWLNWNYSQCVTVMNNSKIFLRVASCLWIFHFSQRWKSLCPRDGCGSAIGNAHALFGCGCCWLQQCIGETIFLLMILRLAASPHQDNETWRLPTARKKFALLPVPFNNSFSQVSSWHWRIFFPIHGHTFPFSFSCWCCVAAQGAALAEN